MLHVLGLDETPRELTAGSWMCRRQLWFVDFCDSIRRNQTACQVVASDTITKLIHSSSGQEQALYVLLTATGMRVSEALTLETQHFINQGRTISVEQQVEKNAPSIVCHLKTDAAKREIDLHPDIAEYLCKYAAGKTGLLFQTTAIWRTAGSLPGSSRWD